MGGRRAVPLSQNAAIGKRPQRGATGFGLHPAQPKHGVSKIGRDLAASNERRRKMDHSRRREPQHRVWCRQAESAQPPHRSVPKEPPAHAWRGKGAGADEDMNLQRETHTQQAKCGAVATKGLLGLMITKTKNNSAIDVDKSRFFLLNGNNTTEARQCPPMRAFPQQTPHCLWRFYCRKE